MKNNFNNEKGSFLALVPFLLFIFIYLSAGLYMQSKNVPMAFYQFPAVVAMAIAVVVAFCNRKQTINENFTIFAKGAGNESIMTMLIIYLLAGGFASVAKAMGGVDATVNMGLSFIPAQFLVAGVFIISAFLGLATGSSMGTVGAIIPIALGVADKAGLALPLVLASCVGGAMFGDNLSMISDTTIAATQTQNCALRDKFKVNFLIALPASIITIIILVVTGQPDSVIPLEELSYTFVKVIPYMLVLLLALAGLNVFLVLSLGIVSAGLIGIFAGGLTVFTFSQAIWGGFTSMSEVFLLSMLGGGLAALTTHYGGFKWLLGKISAVVRGKRSAQLGVAALVSAADIATANNTVAIIITGDIAKKISTEYKIDPRKTASLLDIFSCVFQGIIPYGAQLLATCNLVGDRVSPLAMLPFMWYTHILAIVAIVAIFVPFADGVIRKDPWNWEFNVPESEVEEKKASLELLTISE
ncbi:MAG: Na+/H+ antiporter NhaC family protein [Synergistaceae bacterium]